MGVSLFCLFVLSFVGVFVCLIVFIVCVCGCIGVLIMSVAVFCCGCYFFVCFYVFANASFLVGCLMCVFFLWVVLKCCFFFF